MSQDLDKTLWVGNLSEKVTEDILYELFLQAGPLTRVSIAKEKDGRPKSFAFITFAHDASVPYTINMMEGIHLYGRNLRLQSRPGSIHQQQQQQQQPRHQQQQHHHQQQQMPSQQGQGHFQNVQNPYQNTQQAPFNPYGTSRPTRNPHQAHTPPQLNKSHTWHGDDLEQPQVSRDRDSRGSRDHDRYSNRDRDRSGSQRRDDDGGRGWRGDRGHSREDDRQNSSNNADNKMKCFSSSDMEAKRQKVLQRTDQMVSRYRGQNEGSSRAQHQQWQSKPYNNRRGRYQ